MIIDKFGDTTDTVAAHIALRSVEVKHMHVRICPLGRLNQDQSVAADTVVPVRDALCQRRRILNLFGKAIYIYIVVSATLHLCKFHLFSFS